MNDTSPAGATLTAIIDRYKADAESVFNTWFVGGEKRMKAFRAIGRGVKETVDGALGMKRKRATA